MKIEVLVKAGVKGVTGVTEAPDGSLVVRVSARAHDGEANAVVCSLLAKHYGVSKGSVRIIRGEKSKHKLIEIN